jgi:hypothetical protein
MLCKVLSFGLGFKKLFMAALERVIQTAVSVPRIPDNLTVNGQDMFSTESNC